MEVSTETLINSEYKVICPQCLCQLHIVGDYAYIQLDDGSLKLDTTVEPSRVVTCPKCGHEASSNAHFCPNCGSSFDEPVNRPTGNAVDVAPEDVTVVPPPLPGQDPLYDEAVKFLMTCISITPMMLRDRFGITDERAAELMRQLEQGGVVGPYNHGGPRQILIPHATLYGAPPQVDNGQNTGGQQQGRVPRRGGLGCIGWLLVVMAFVYLLKACGM